MPRAASLAATIRSEFGIDAELIEGHGGIYELIINDTVAYSNQSSCGRFPTDEEIFAEIRKYRDPVKAEEKTPPVADEKNTAPSCCLPDESCC